MNSFGPTQPRQGRHVLFSTRIRDTHPHAVVSAILRNTMSQHSRMFVFMEYMHGRLYVSLLLPVT